MIILSVRIKFIPFKGGTKTGISSRKSLAPSPRGQRAHHVKCVAFAWRVIFQNRLGLKKQVCACIYVWCEKYWTHILLFWLVVSNPLRNMKVNGKDYPIYYGKIKAIFQTTN